LRCRPLERLGLDAVAVGLVEQLIEHRQELGRQRKSLEFGDHALDGQSLLALFLETGQGRLENFSRGPAKAAFTFAVEIDRR
jgi:alkylation response protein AidB-like acyl-CoA dehydrogenase